MCGYVNKGTFKALRRRTHNEAVARAEIGGTHRVFQVKKNGDLYKNPHLGLRGNELFTYEDACQEAARMMNLNRGKTFIVK